QLDFLVVIDTDGHPSCEAGDVLLPIATHVETAGTFTNRQRRVQLARQAFAPPGQVQEGWLVLSELGRRITGWELHPSAESVFKEIAAQTPAFAGLDYGKIGLHGTDLGA
ncbi:MAG TPA: molybdopterin-dependent oxidoreductase, partial [Candidatus Kryptonia bacterium]|nr:molybdopterin-dependent oxidoreductase [Candidatus Kryptonia bacterium]